MKRLQVYKDFKKYAQKKDTRDMDNICKSDSTFTLQAQQNLLRAFMQTNPNWKSLLLYHKIGSGKTCTAITMAEEYIKTVGGTVKVILPARLKTNFLDELMSPCANGRYMSSNDLALYNDHEESIKKKQILKSEFLKKLKTAYQLYSFEGVKLLVKKNKNNIEKWVKEFTKDSMIIIDEVHNLITDKYKLKEAKKVLTEGKMEKPIKGMNAVLLKMLTTFADPSCKFLFLTATPIFDNIAQMRELVIAMDPDVQLPSAQSTKLNHIIEALRGKVSYFPGTSDNAYPAVEHVTHSIPLSRLQDIDTNAVQIENDGGPITVALQNRHKGGGNDEVSDDLSESFLAKQRQIAISCTKDAEVAASDLKKYAPKVLEIVKTIEKNKGKHLVFSNFIKAGLDIVAAALVRRGWKHFGEEGAQKGKVFAFWGGSTSDSNKQLIKVIANNKKNILGDDIRVILGSPSVKEGVSFKHIQHMHMLDPVWNTSAKDQVEGRAIRYCSHIDIIPEVHKLERKVIVHLYKIVPRKGGLVQMTCDEFIYEELIPRKEKLVKAAEKALQKVAIDHYLFRRMTEDDPEPTPESVDGPSPLILGEDAEIGVRRGVRDGNTCPKKRRPALDFKGENPKCGEDMEARKNPAGFYCCYKQKRKTEKNKQPSKPKCPPSRVPYDDGTCDEGFYLKENKHGIPCCFKKRVVKKKGE